MTLQNLTILLPCHSLEDFPLHHEGVEADGLLAGWTALWHPQLIAAAGGIAQWERADDPTDPVEGALIVIPQVSQRLLRAGWPQRAAQAGAVVLEGYSDRGRLLEEAFARLEMHGGVDADLAADFLALGFAYLQLELLTRQMRYMSNVDELHLRNETLAASQAAVGGDGETARVRLRHAFEVLEDARERFYAVDSYLVDLTLVAEQVPASAVCDELRSPVPINLWGTSGALETLLRENRALEHAVRTAIDAGTAGLIGGTPTEDELPLFSPEPLLAAFLQGREQYARLVGRAPRVFGRRRYGLTPFLPQVLAQLDYIGAIHVTLDDGQFPVGQQSKIRWEGMGGASVDALARVPLDASLPESFLSLSAKTGQSMDFDHVATVSFAHWPGAASTWYGDLRRAAAQCTALGRFVTVEEYFERTEAPGRLTSFAADDYRAPYLRQQVAAGCEKPLTDFARRGRGHGMQYACSTLKTLAELLGANRAFGPGGDADGEPARSLATSMGCGPAEYDRGTLVVNPLTSPLRRVIRSWPTALPVASAESAPARYGNPLHPQAAPASIEGEALTNRVELPAVGYAWIDPRAPEPAETAPTARWPWQRRRVAPLMAEDLTLRNEAFELRIDPQTGGIHAIHDFRTRGNRLSQQLALRRPGPTPRPGDVWRDRDEAAGYSTMVADGIEVTQADESVGEITSRGRLVDEQGAVLARFVQQLRAMRGRPIVELLIDLELDEPPDADPWESYYCCRFAWPDETAELFRSVHGVSQSTTAKRLEAPDFVDIRTEATRTTLLTGGLPYHRRSGPRTLDTLLVAGGETARRFQLGVAIDAAHPLPVALELEPPLVQLQGVACPPAGPTGWFMQVDKRNVVATAWQTVKEDGRVVGFRVRLLESDGLPGRVHLGCFRPLSRADQIDFLGRPLVSLRVEGDRVAIDLSAGEWAQIEARFAQD